MAAENFFSRWSRRKVAAVEDKQAPPAAAQPSVAPVQDKLPAATQQAEQPGAGQTKPPLTMEDVANLTHDSDYSAFVARGVDENVKRSALKKLFSDPHFNVMDGLDTYIEDFNKFEPIPPEMLAALNHARSLLDPLAHLEKPMMRVADNSDQSEHPVAQADQQQTDQPELTASATTEDPAAPPADVEQAPGSGEENEAAPEATIDPVKLSQARP
jgi:hypothetical protein